MARREIDAFWDRKTRNNLNENFKELYNEYREAGLNAKEARNKAEQAVTDALIAKETAEVTREEMLEIIREQTRNGDLATEIAQARGDKATLGERLNSVDSQLAHNTAFVVDRTCNNQIVDRGANGAAVFIDDDFKPHLRNTIIP